MTVNKQYNNQPTSFANTVIKLTSFNHLQSIIQLDGLPEHAIDQKATKARYATIDIQLLNSGGTKRQH